MRICSLCNEHNTFCCDTIRRSLVAPTELDVNMSYFLNFCDRVSVNLDLNMVTQAGVGICLIIS